MKTRIFKYLLFSFVLFFAFSCKDEEAEPAFRINDIEHGFLDVNTCEFDTGVNGTNFAFELDVEKPDNMTVDRIILDINFINGSTFDNIIVDDLTFSGDKIRYARCYRFDTTIGVSITHTLVATDGTRSEPFTVTVNKPSGAN